MGITEYQIENQEKWDNVVKSFSNYDVFYLSGYVKAFMKENIQNGTPILLMYEDGNDRAVNIVFCRDIAQDPKMRGSVEPGILFDLITPYGYGGFWGNISDWGKLNETYITYCKAKGYVCEFVRFELFSDYAFHYDGSVESRSHNVVRSLELPLEDIWMDYKQKVRKNVNKANSYHLKCLIESSDVHLDDFLRIYYSTMERTQAEKQFFFSKGFFEDLCEMKDSFMFFHVVYEGKIISTELVIYGSENCYSFLGGTYQEYMYVRPNDYLKHEIIKWAKEKGLKNFVLGGGYGSDDGIFQYKFALAPHGVVDFYIGRRIFNHDAYDRLVGIRGDTLDLEDRFFPLYRSIGKQEEKR